MNYRKTNNPEQTGKEQNFYTGTPKITAQMLVKNEEQWVWYALNSVLPYVEKVIVFDTGSTDLTREIIKSINSPKIILYEKGNADRRRLVDLRNEMLSLTGTDWFLLVDGDEVWPGLALEKLVGKIAAASSETWGIVIRTRNCVGDIWHYQPENAGRYRLLEKKGHLTIRAYRKIPGFFWKGEYPLEFYSDSGDKPLNTQTGHLQFLDTSYWHLTHLRRTSRPDGVIDRPGKFKLETGRRANKTELPEVFFRDRPEIVPSPFIKFNLSQLILAGILTPLRTLKRMFGL